MSLTTLFIIVLIVALLGVLPVWPYSRRWRWAPSIIMATILVAVIFLAAEGRY